MKKLITLLMVLCMLCTAILVSCGENTPPDTGDVSFSDISDTQSPGDIDSEQTSDDSSSVEITDARTLYQTIDQKMNSLDSYQATTLMNFTVYPSGNKLQSTARGQMIEAGVNTDSYYYFNKTVNKMTCEALNLDDEITSVLTYDQGNAYIYTRGDELDQKLYAPITQQEFIDHVADSSVTDIDLMDCTKQEFSKTEDGGWHLSCSGYTKKAIEAFAKASELTDALFGGKIMDMAITLTADREFHAKQMTVTLEFDGSKDPAHTPELTMTVDYSDYNSAKIILNYTSTEYYTNVLDIRLLDKFGDKIKELQNAEYGAFTYDVEQTVTMMGSTSRYKETDTIRYSSTGNDYYYNITADIDTTRLNIEYKNGIQYVYENGVSMGSGAQTVEDAKAYINALINPVNYNKQYVSSIEQISEGIYKVTCNAPDSTAYEAVFVQMGGYYKSAKQIITFTLQNDKIVRIQNEVEAQGAYTSGNSTYAISLKIKSTSLFEG